MDYPGYFAAIPGRGVEAQVNGRLVRLGTQALLQDAGIDVDGLAQVAAELAASGKTPLFVASDDQAVGVIAVADTPKEGAASEVARLKGLGVEVVMLTGDNSRAAAAIARELGIDEVESEVMPENKVEVVKRLQARGNVVAMVGDGINDAPALVQADVGIAMGTGADVAMESADVTLMRGDLAGVGRRVDVEPVDHPSYQAEPVLGVLLQRYAHTRGCRSVVSGVQRAGRCAGGVGPHFSVSTGFSIRSWRLWPWPSVR